jgi:hypothetical protein
MSIHSRCRDIIRSLFLMHTILAVVYLLAKTVRIRHVNTPECDPQ